MCVCVCVTYENALWGHNINNVIYIFIHFTVYTILYKHTLLDYIDLFNCICYL